MVARITITYDYVETCTAILRLELPVAGDEDCSLHPDLIVSDSINAHIMDYDISDAWGFVGGYEPNFYRYREKKFSAENWAVLDEKIEQYLDFIHRLLTQQIQSARLKKTLLNKPQTRRLQWQLW